MRNSRLHFGFIAGLLSTSVCSQERPLGPVFEVASVRPHDRNVTSGGFAFQHGRLTISNAPLRNLIRNAYKVHDFQISGGPSWMDSERFDILAKAPEGSSPEDLNRMLQALLAERFRLVIRRETRESPVYALVVAKNGLKMQRSAPDAEYTMRSEGGGMSDC